MKKIKSYKDTWAESIISGTDKEFKERLKKLDKIWEESIEKPKDKKNKLS